MEYLLNQNFILVIIFYLKNIQKIYLLKQELFEAIVKTQILPIAYEFRKSLAEGIKSIESVCSKEHSVPERNIIEITTPIVIDLQKYIDSITTMIKEVW
ncbi:unnamed protein product [Rhizophagus irregularis]|nr:unnamed protein product [Rhizophagus irregularis]